MDTYLGKCGTYPEVVVSRVTGVGIIATKKLIEYRIMRERGKVISCISKHSQGMN